MGRTCARKGASATLAVIDIPMNGFRMESLRGANGEMHQPRTASENSFGEGYTSTKPDANTLLPPAVPFPETFLLIRKFHDSCRPPIDASRLIFILDRMIEIAGFDFYLAEEWRPNDLLFREENLSCLSNLRALLREITDGRLPSEYDLYHGADALIMQLVCMRDRFADDM